MVFRSTNARTGWDVKNHQTSPERPPTRSGCSDPPRDQARLRIVSISFLSPASFRVAAVLLVAALVSGCGLFGSDTPRIDGVYQGDSSIEGSEWEIRLALSEAESNVISGAGSMHQVATDRTISFQIQGVHTYPDVTLTLKSNGFSDKDFTGTVSSGGDSLSGKLRDRNFVADVDLGKQ